MKTQSAAWERGKAEARNHTADMTLSHLLFVDFLSLPSAPETISFGRNLAVKLRLLPLRVNALRPKL